jgi:hypothetical protein
VDLTHADLLSFFPFLLSYYVALSDASSAGEGYETRGVGHSLHDVTFSDISSKRVGMQVRTYSAKDLPGFPEARKLLLWQAA